MLRGEKLDPQVAQAIHKENEKICSGKQVRCEALMGNLTKDKSLVCISAFPSGREAHYHIKGLSLDSPFRIPFSQVSTLLVLRHVFE